MMSLLMEAVVVAFALGGVVGAVIAVHLVHKSKQVHGLAKEIADEQILLQREARVRVKIPPRR